MQTETVTIDGGWEAYCDDCSAHDAEATVKTTAQVKGWARRHVQGNCTHTVVCNRWTRQLVRAKPDG